MRAIAVLVLSVGIVAGKRGGRTRGGCGRRAPPLAVRHFAVRAAPSRMRRRFRKIRTVYVYSSLPMISENPVRLVG